MSFNVPTTTVSVSFTDPFDTPDWVDITRWVKQGSVKRGRQHELQQVTAGTAQLTISNQDGRFSTFNTNSPYVNMMSAADSYFSGVTPTTAYAATGVPNWNSGTNTTLAIVGGAGYDGLPAIGIKSTGAAAIQAQNHPGSVIGYPASAGTTYNFQAQFKAAATGRSCSINVYWFNSSQIGIGSPAIGSGVSSNTSTWTKATLTATAPANTAYAQVTLNYTASGSGEVQYATRLFMGVPDAYGNALSQWTAGGHTLSPARPLKIVANWSSTNHPIYYGYVDQWLPSYGVVSSDQVLNCTDGLNLLALSYLTTSGYKYQVATTDGAIGYYRLGDAVPPFADTTGNTPSLAVTNVAATTVTTSQTPALAGDSDAAIALNIGGASGGYALGTVGLVSSSASYASAGPAWTLECWAKIPAPPTLAISPIVQVGLGGTYLTIGAAASTGYIQGGGSGGLPGTTTNICDNAWHHLAVTVTSGGTVTSYVDGVQAGTSAGSSIASPLTGFQIGPLNAGQGTFYVDEVAVYPTALSGATLTTHYNLGKTGWIQQQSGQRVAAVLNSLGVPAAQQAVATGISAVQAPASSLAGTQALSHLQAVTKTEQGLLFCDESGNYTFLDRHYVIQNAAAVVSNGTFASDNNGAHYKYLVGSIIPAVDALDLWNNVPAAATTNAGIGVAGTVQYATSATSRRTYGSRTLPGFTGLLQTTDVEALSLAQWLLAHYSTPVARVRQMKLDSTASGPSSLPQMLGRKLWDRITVIWQPMDGTASPFTQDSLIEGVQHDFGPDLWTTTWNLSVAETQQYLTLNDSTYGKLDSNRLGY